MSCIKEMRMAIYLKLEIEFQLRLRVGNEFLPVGQEILALN